MKPLLRIASALVGMALSLPAGADELWPSGLRPLGAGEMRWFGFKLYQAQLLVVGERFDPEAAFALKLTYARDFSRQELVSTSIDEIRRLGEKDEAILAHWRNELWRVLPDVSKGQSLLGRHEPGRGMSLFHDGRLIGEVRDVRLARAFFAIWLDPRTRATELRTRLLGASG